MKTFLRIVPGVALLVLIAQPVRAQGFVSATIGAATSDLVRETATTYGGALGYWTSGLIGFEGDYGFSAKTRGGDVGDNIRTLMFDVLVGPKLGGGEWRGYGAAGVGLMGAAVTTSDIFKFSSDEVDNDFGMNAGGGVIGFFNDHFGIRVDGRYFLDLKTPEGGGKKGHFIRFGGGVAIRF